MVWSLSIVKILLIDDYLRSVWNYLRLMKLPEWHHHVAQVYRKT